MIQPNDVMNIDSENWEDFKKEAMKDALYYNGPGDLLDTEKGRARFCRLNETGVFRKPDPDFPNYKIWVFNNQGSPISAMFRPPSVEYTLLYHQRPHPARKSRCSRWDLWYNKIKFSHSAFLIAIPGFFPPAILRRPLSF